MALAYRYTHEPECIELFYDITDYFVQHLPADRIPYWDLTFTDGDEPRDSSAAAVAACKKQLLLSGTIANGYATSIFYLLYRVDPRKMQKLGYGWHDVMKFAKRYGTIETLYDSDVSDNGNYNSCSRGRQITTPKVKPGISPMLTLDFTLPVEITLDLSDMSKFLLLTFE